MWAKGPDNRDDNIQKYKCRKQISRHTPDRGAVQVQRSFGRKEIKRQRQDQELRNIRVSIFDLKLRNRSKIKQKWKTY
jgi:hypothetical protein